jgi:predicted nicotinamide N-methyase
MSEQGTEISHDGGAGGFEAGGVPLAEFTFQIGGRAWRVRAARDHASLMEASDRFFAFPFGLLLWESAIGLAAELAERPETVAGRTVLEVGAGVGLPGIVARAAGAAAVLQTDHVSEALALCRINAEANGVAGIELAFANWDAWTDEHSYDVIIGSDIVYERSAHAALVAILERNLAAGGRALIADQGRQDTPLFIADLAARGWQSRQRQRTAPALMPGGADTVTIDIIELWR